PGIAIRGSGNLNEADFSANIDLTKFQTEWSRVLNTANWTARGTLEGTFSSRQAGPNRYQLAGQAKGQNISLGTSGALPWEFPELKTTVSGTVLHDQHLTLDTLSFDLETDKEQLSAQKKPDGIWNLSASGNLDGVVTRLLSLSPTERITGRYRFGTQFQSAATVKRFNDLKLTIEDLVWSSGTRRVDEQQLIVEGNLSYSSQTGSIEIPGLTLNSATVAARLTDARFERNTDRPSFAGQLAARGRLERIVQLLGINSKDSDPSGLLNLQVKATRNPDHTTDFRWKMFTEGLDWKTTPRRLPTHAVSWAPSAESTPLKSEMTFGGAGKYLPSEQRLELTESEFDAGFLQLNLAGHVTGLNSAPLLTVSGKCDYDWLILRQRFPDLLDPEFDIRGEHSSPVTLSIPLNSSARDNMSGTIPIQWESASWSGLTIGPGRTDAVLSASRIDVQPLKTSVAGGTVRLSPAVIFTDRGTVIEQTPETIFDQVHLSEEICQNWLKYISPLTADASRVEGTFSLETSKLLHFPLADKKAATGTGVLQIHSARMSPGPLAMQIVTLEKQIEAIRKGTPFAGQANADPRAVLTIQQQVVPFEIKDNRVTHRDLKMKIKDLDIRTSGSVGFDETLDLTVEMEIPPSWTIQGKRLRDILGTSIQIPIRGSLNKPLADPRFVDTLLKQLVKGSATNFLENQLNKQLNNLFGPKK
ncbi:MAG TPA: hypothetical protein VLA12_22505, partial [Planctomycetaceae bacterium]|nr:hypothetical protein [Planctomycetaceae bacterium]